MDPSIMKLLEDDEDETMHSGADVEAFTAALNRDIEGDASTSQPSESEAVLSQGSNPTASDPSFAQWQASTNDKNTNSQSNQNLQSSTPEDQHSSGLEPKQHGSGTEIQQHQIDTSSLQQKQSQDAHQQNQEEQQNNLQFSHTSSMKIPEQNPVQIQEKMNSNQPAPPAMEQPNNPMEQPNNPMKAKQVPFGLLLPVIMPQLDKDRAMQLNTLYLKLKKNEITKEVFVRHMRGIVGDYMLRQAVHLLHQNPVKTQPNQNLQTGPSQFQFHQKGQSTPVDPSQGPASSQGPTLENNAQKSREMERQFDSHGMQVSQLPSSSLSSVEKDRPPMSIQGLSKQQSMPGGTQHLHFPQTPIPMYGNTVYSTSLKPQPHIPLHQSMPGGTQSMTMMGVPKFERSNPVNDLKRMPGGSLSHLQPWQSSTSKEQKGGGLSTMAFVKQEPVEQASEQQQQHKSQLSNVPGLSSFPSTQVDQGNTMAVSTKEEALEKQASRMGFSTSTSMVSSNPVSSSMMGQLEASVPLASRIPSSTSPVGIGNIARTPQKKPITGMKKPLETLGSSPPLSSKKQKVSGAFSDQSIEQLNDVTAVSGVNLREEEEQLFSGAKEDSRVSEASRRVVQEEEERLLLQKAPLQKKIAQIMAKSGLRSISSDVGRCLSLCVEERLRGLLSNLIRLSKQRVDVEKQRHRTVITSDVRNQILVMNRRAREEWEKKQAEAEKLRKLNEPEGGSDGDKDKDEGRVKSLKANKEEDDKMRTTAANVAARAAVGGDDMLSKWQLMAEQARQKREGGTDAVASSSQQGKDVGRKPSSSTKGRNLRDHQEGDKRSHSATAASGAAASGNSRKIGRSQVSMGQTRVARSITVKDVIAVLEREPQMSKSTLIYRLYDKVRSAADASPAAAITPE